MLTTFNEADMTQVMGTARRHKDAFEKKHAPNSASWDFS